MSKLGIDMYFIAFRILVVQSHVQHRISFYFFNISLTFFLVGFVLTHEACVLHEKKGFQIIS